MNRCPITYKPCQDEERYSLSGLRLLSPNLKQLVDFPYDARQQRREAVIHAAKMSIQGVQPKLSVRLNAKAGLFEIMDCGGRYVIKPQHDVYPHLPENEGLTLHLAGLCGIDVPLSGLVRCADGSWSYFIRRFDRVGHNSKLSVEDFAQLAGLSRETKYDFSMERLVKLLDAYCTFPAIEKVSLFKRCLFNFIVGNEDMHVKNFSLLTRDGKVVLAPAYDYLSTTVAFLSIGKRPDQIEEIALPLQGKKRGLTRNTWVEYFAHERLALPDKIVGKVLTDIQSAVPFWKTCLANSFLPTEHQTLYARLLGQRLAVLGIG
jgi:serine/threonine-protein kinase HipA